MNDAADAKAFANKTAGLRRVERLRARLWAQLVAMQENELQAVAVAVDEILAKGPELLEEEGNGRVEED